MSFLYASIDSLDNNILNVSWGGIRGSQLSAVNSLTRRRFIIKDSIVLNNNSIRVNLALLKRVQSLLNGNYYLQSVSPNKTLRTGTFVVQDTPVVVTIKPRANRLTIDITNPSSLIDPVKLYMQDASATQFIIFNYGTSPDAPLATSQTFDLDTLPTFSGALATNGFWTVCIAKLDNTLVVQSEPFYYNTTGIWPLDQVVAAGNTASTDIDLDGHDLLNVHNLTIMGSTGAAGQVLSTDGTALAWIDPPSLSPASDSLDMDGHDIINVHQLNFQGSTIESTDQGIYAQTDSFNIFNAGVVTYNDDGTIDQVKVGDVHIDAGPNGNVTLGGAAQTITLNSALNTNGYDIKGNDGIILGGTIDGTTPENPNQTNVTLGARLNMNGNEIQNCPSIFNESDTEMIVGNFQSGGVKLGYQTGPTTIVGTTIQIKPNGPTPGDIIIGDTNTNEVALQSILNTNGHEVKECIVISGSGDTLSLINKNTGTGGNISIQASSAHDAVAAGRVYVQSDLDMTNHRIVGLGAPLTYSYTSLPTLDPSQVGYSTTMATSPVSGSIPRTEGKISEFTIPFAGIYYVFFICDSNIQSGVTTFSLLQGGTYLDVYVTPYSGTEINPLRAMVTCTGATTFTINGQAWDTSTFGGAKVTYTRIG